MSADNLSPSSRAFYESVRMKMTLSIFFGAVGLYALGSCSVYGGLANNAYYYQQLVDDLKDDEQASAFESLRAGYGLACFFAIIGFLLLTSIAVYYSPLLCGSTNEKKLLNRPQEIEDGYSNNNFSTEVQPGPAHQI